MFIALAIILVIFIIGFICFFTYLRKMTNEAYIRHCTKKVGRIAKRKHCYSILNLNLLNHDREKLSANHVIFGKKYIYLISDFMLKGFVSGEVNDNSWVYFNNITKQTHYLDNLDSLLSKNTHDFAGILGISADPIISICLVPNECDLTINGLENKNRFIVHYNGLNRIINTLERKQIGSFKQEQIFEQYQTIKKRNEER